MKILITGGAGFIGTHLRKNLLADGHFVRILDNLLPQVHGDDPHIDHSESEFIRGDVRDPRAVSGAMKGIETVYHLAAETGVGQSQYEIERYISTNTLGTAVVLQEAVSSGVNQVVISSSRAVYGEGLHECPDCGHRFVPESRWKDDLAAGRWEIACPACEGIAVAKPMNENDPLKPVSVYGLTKVQQEQIAAQVGRVYQVPITNLRFFNVFGPGQSLNNPYVGVLGTFFRRIKSGKDIEIYEDGKMRRDFVYVDDVVKALRLVHGNEQAFDRTINVGNGTPVTLELAGREMFRLLGKEERMHFTGKFRLGDIHHAIADTTWIEQTLNYVPATSFSKGLGEFISWASDSGYDTGNIDAVAEMQLRERNLLGQARR